MPTLSSVQQTATPYPNTQGAVRCLWLQYAPDDPNPRPRGLLCLLDDTYPRPQVFVAALSTRWPQPRPQVLVVALCARWPQPRPQMLVAAVSARWPPPSGAFCCSMRQMTSAPPSKACGCSICQMTPTLRCLWLLYLPDDTCPQVFVAAVSTRWPPPSGACGCSIWEMIPPSGACGCNMRHITPVPALRCLGLQYAGDDPRPQLLAAAISARWPQPHPQVIVAALCVDDNKRRKTPSYCFTMQIRFSVSFLDIWARMPWCVWRRGTYIYIYKIDLPLNVII